MNTHETITTLHRSARLCALALACTTAACSAEPNSETDSTTEPTFRAGEGGQAIEDPNDPPGEVIDEGSEGNAGVEGQVTITKPQLAELFSQAGVGSSLQQQSSAGYVGDAITDDAAAKIAQITGEPIESSQPSGAQTFGSTTSYRFRVDPTQNELSIRHKSKLFSDVPASAVVGEAQILTQAQADLAILDVALGEGQSLEVSELMRASSTDPDHPNLAAYKVFVDLEIDGHPVLGPRLVLSYFLDGELHKVSATWPEIDSASGPAPLPSPGAILTAVYGKLAAHPLGAETNPLEAGAALTVDGGELHHVVLVQGLLDNGEGTGQGRMGQLDVVF